MGKLDGKTAIVTGASSGIGLATARALGREGAAVVLAGRKREPMDDAAKTIARALVQQADVRDEMQMGALVDAAVAEFGSLDIMVNNAGYNPFPSTASSRATSPGGRRRWRSTCWARRSAAGRPTE